MSSDRVLQFEYPAVMAKAQEDRSGGGQLFPLEEEVVKRATPDQQGMREIQAREIGRHEGEAKAKAQYEESLRAERARIAEALESFRTERARYFEQVEYEVVQLALAIAKRVLRREAQVDPDLLTGLVRYTLEKLRDGTRVKLRVSPANLAAWRMQFPDHIEVMGDASVEAGSCVVETEVGTTAVNVDTQLKEIENGLMDLLAQRPTGKG